MHRPRLPWVRALVICSIGALSIGVLRADSKKAEAQALLDRAEQLSRLTTKGSPPFALEATVEHGGGKEKKTANFYLLWQDAEHWRAMAVEGDRRELHVRNPEGMWQPKLLDPELMWVFHDSMNFPFKHGVAPWDGEKIEGLRGREVKNTALSCVRVRVSNTEREFCFDSGGLLTRAVFGGTARPDTVVEYDGYVQFGKKWIPQEIRRTVGGHLKSDLRVVRLDANPQAPEQSFSKLPDYEVWADCETYSDVQPIHSGPGPDFVLQGTVDLSKPAEGMFVVIGPDGKALEVRFVNPVGRSANNWAYLFMKMRYRPATCDGKPVSSYVFMPPASERLP